MNIDTNDQLKVESIGSKRFVSIKKQDGEGYHCAATSLSLLPNSIRTPRCCLRSSPEAAIADGRLVSSTHFLLLSP